MTSIFNGDENQGSNDGIRSKFQYRIKLIKKNRYQKRVRQESEQEEFVREIIDKIREVKRSSYTVRYKKGLPTKVVVKRKKSQQVKGKILVEGINPEDVEERIIVIKEGAKRSGKLDNSGMKVEKEQKNSYKEGDSFKDDIEKTKNQESDDFIREVITNVRKTAKDRDYGLKKKGVATERKVEKAISDEVEKERKEKSKNHEDYIKDVFSDIRRTAEDRDYGLKKKGVANGRKSEKIISNKGLKETVKNHEDYIKEVFSDIRRTSGDRDYGLKRKGVAPLDGEVTRYGHKKDAIKENISTNRQREEYKAELAVSIVNQMKKNFERKKNELEVLESELYEALEQTEYELEKEKIEEIKRRIEEILKKIEEIKKQYDIFRDNYCLENVLDIDNPLLLDNIIQYKYLVDSSEERIRLVEDYKLMDEFQSLYAKLEEINYISDEVQQRNEEKLKEIEKRDAKHDEVKNSLEVMDSIEEQFEYDIKNQDEYLKQLLLKIDKIDRHEYTKYKMEGLNILLGQMIKYMGLLMVSPLAGMLPMIAIDTLATKRMLKQLWKQFQPEVIKKVEFSAYDYDRELLNKLDDISYATNLIDSTLDDIAVMKESFMMEYNSDIPGYRDTLDKLNTIEDKIRNNKYKTELIRKKLKKSRKINEDKLIRVKELNKHNHAS